ARARRRGRRQHRPVGRFPRPPRAGAHPAEGLRRRQLLPAVSGRELLPALAAPVQRRPRHQGPSAGLVHRTVDAPGPVLGQPDPPLPRVPMSARTVPAAAVVGAAALAAVLAAAPAGADEADENRFRAAIAALRAAGPCGPLRPDPT